MLLIALVLGAAVGARYRVAALFMLSIAVLVVLPQILLLQSMDFSSAIGLTAICLMGLQGGYFATQVTKAALATRESWSQQASRNGVASQATGLSIRVRK